MSEYIRREDALKSIDTHDASVKEDVRLHSEDFYEFKSGVDYAWKMIKHDVPTVDAVEVVRCKDCERRFTHDCPCYPQVMPDDWFCKDGW